MKQLGIGNAAVAAAEKSVGTLRNKISVVAELGFGFEVMMREMMMMMMIMLSSSE